MICIGAIMFWGESGSWINRDFESCFVLTLKFYHTVNEGEQRVILAQTYIVARMKTRSTLTHKYIAG